MPRSIPVFAILEYDFDGPRERFPRALGRPGARLHVTRLVAVQWESLHALSIRAALFRWLVEQRYVRANPFAGVKVRGSNPTALDASRAFTDGGWALVRTMADGLEWSYGWSAPAAQRLRLLRDFGYATGLRASELVWG